MSDSTYQFTGKLPGGQAVSGRIKAQGLNNAYAILGTRGLTDIQVTPLSGVHEVEQGRQPYATARANSISLSPGTVLVVLCVLASVLAVAFREPIMRMLSREQTADLTQGQSGLPQASVTSPTQSASSFDANAVRAAIASSMADLNGEMAERATRAGLRYQWTYADPVVSIRQGTEVGYDYDILISYTEYSAANALNGQAGSCQVVLHVSSDYQVASVVSTSGSAHQWHAEIFAEAIRNSRQGASGQ